MKFAYDLQGNSEIVRDYPVFGNGANIVEGAAVMKGATAGTDQPFVNLASGAVPDAVGIMKVLHTNTVAGDDSNTTGTNYTVRPVIINPFAVYQAEFDQTDTMTVTSTSGTTVTIGSLESGLDGGYLYAVSGTGAGRLAFIVTSTSGSCTTKETTAWDSTTTVIKIVPLWHPLVKLNSTSDKIGTDAGAGSAVVTVLDTWIESDSVPKVRLNPTLHSGLTGLQNRNVKFYADIIFRNHVLNTID